MIFCRKVLILVKVKDRRTYFLFCREKLKKKRSLRRFGIGGYKRGSSAAGMAQQIIEQDAPELPHADNLDWIEVDGERRGIIFCVPLFEQPPADADDNDYPRLSVSVQCMHAVSLSLNDDVNLGATGFYHYISMPANAQRLLEDMRRRETEGCRLSSNNPWHQVYNGTGRSEMLCIGDVLICIYRFERWVRKDAFAVSAMVMVYQRTAEIEAAGVYGHPIMNVDCMDLDGPKAFTIGPLKVVIAQEGERRPPDDCIFERWLAEPEVDSRFGTAYSNFYKDVYGL